MSILGGVGSLYMVILILILILGLGMTGIGFWNFIKNRNNNTIKATNAANIEVMDMSDDDSPLQNDATVLGVNGCVIEIFNAVSPDEDGLNDFFRIRGIECYPKNTVEIYNRWGIKVYDVAGYNNNSIAFRGVSDGRVTVSQSEGLPSGTYFYILKYEDSENNGISKSGYLDLKRD